MSKTLTWGLLSTARINRRLIAPIKKSKRSELVGVASRTQKTAQEFGSKWNIPRIFSSYEAMLESPNMNAIYIPLPNNMHHEWVLKAAQAGKHILCEKPLALTTQEVKEMATAATENNIVLLEAFAYRMHPQLQRVKETIKRGVIGNVKLIRSKFSFSLREANNIRLKKALGGGSLWDVGCYPVSFAQAIVEANPVEVFAWQTLGGDGVDTTLTGQLRFANGIMAQIDCSFEVPYRVGAEIVGDEGVLYLPNPFQPDLDGRKNGFIHITPNDKQTTIKSKNMDPYLAEVQAIEDAVFNHKSTPYSLTESLGNVATIKALYKSAETGKPVLIDDPSTMLRTG